MDKLVVLTISVCALISACTCQCPDAWVQFKGSCYLFSHENKPFTDAEHFCLQHQAHLVSIENSDEDNFLKSHSADLKDANHWIGLTDADIEGVWVWTDGSSADYLNWNTGEPNGQKREDCATLYVSVQYAWNDAACTASFRPICKKAVDLSNCPTGGEGIIG